MEYSSLLSLPLHDYKLLVVASADGIVQSNLYNYEYWNLFSLHVFFGGYCKFKCSSDSIIIILLQHALEAIASSNRRLGGVWVSRAREENSCTLPCDLPYMGKCYPLPTDNTTCGSHARNFELYTRTGMNSIEEAIKNIIYYLAT